ncbi:peptidoglycan DD-metalloendopeptidase family protein, partial [Patescibacteria group bacterium]|nr:peptidoglycan DD-metalloendopeptidase family protein [Patescibacteria group bacterium]
MKKVLKKVFKTRKNLYRCLALFGVILIAVYVFFRVALKPYDVQITTQTSGGFTVSWRTKIPMIGSAYVADNKFSVPILSSLLSSQFKDERDQDGKSGLFNNHSVTVYGLEPESEYNIRINSGLISYTLKEKAVTAKDIDDLRVPDPSWGQVVEGKINRPVKDSIVKIILKNKSEQSTPLSTVTSQDGTWTIDTGNIFKSDLQDLFKTNKNTKAEIMVQKYDGTTYKTTMSVELTKPSKPLNLTSDMERLTASDKSEDLTSLDQLIGEAYAYSQNVTYNGQSCTCDTNSCNDGTSTCCAVLECAQGCVTGANCNGGHWGVTGVDWGCWGSNYNQSCDDKWKGGGGGEPPAQPPAQPPAGGKEECPTWNDKKAQVKLEFSDNNKTRDIAIYYANKEVKNTYEAGIPQKTYYIDIPESSYNAEGYLIGLDLRVSGMDGNSPEVEKVSGPSMLNVCTGRNGKDNEIVYKYKLVGGAAPPQPPPPAACSNCLAERNNNEQSGNCTSINYGAGNGQCMSSNPDPNMYEDVTGKCYGSSECTGIGKPCEWVCRVPKAAAPPPPGECADCAKETEYNGQPWGQPNSCKNYDPANYQGGICMTGKQFLGQEADINGQWTNYNALGWETVKGQCPGTTKCTGTGKPCEWICRVQPRTDVPVAGQRSINITDFDPRSLFLSLVNPLGFLTTDSKDIFAAASIVETVSASSKLSTSSLTVTFQYTAEDSTDKGMCSISHPSVGGYLAAKSYTLPAGKTDLNGNLDVTLEFSPDILSGINLDTSKNATIQCTICDSSGQNCMTSKKVEIGFQISQGTEQIPELQYDMPKSTYFITTDKFDPDSVNVTIKEVQNFTKVTCKMYDKEPWQTDYPTITKKPIDEGINRFDLLGIDLSKIDEPTWRENKYLAIAECTYENPGKYTGSGFVKIEAEIAVNNEQPTERTLVINEHHIRGGNFLMEWDDSAGSKPSYLSNAAANYGKYVEVKVTDYNLKSGDDIACYIDGLYRGATQAAPYGFVDPHLDGMPETVKIYLFDDQRMKPLSEIRPKLKCYVRASGNQEFAHTEEIDISQYFDLTGSPSERDPKLTNFNFDIPPLTFTYDGQYAPYTYRHTSDYPNTVVQFTTDYKDLKNSTIECHIVGLVYDVSPDAIIRSKRPGLNDSSNRPVELPIIIYKDSFRMKPIVELGFIPYMDCRLYEPDSGGSWDSYIKKESADLQIKLIEQQSPPEVKVTPKPNQGEKPLSTTLEITTNDVEITNHTIKFGDGNEIQNPGKPPGSQDHTYSNPGTYTAEVIVTAANAQSAAASASLTVNNPAPPPPSGNMSPPFKVSPSNSCCFGCVKCTTSGKHNGVDNTIAARTPIYSIADGQVVDIFTWPENGEDAGCGGMYVRIHHPGIGLYAEYYHLDNDVQVSKAQPVSTGTPVGYVKYIPPWNEQVEKLGFRCTVSGGTHLHFGLSRNYRADYVNPCQYPELNVCTKCKADPTEMPACTQSLGLPSNLSGKVSTAGQVGSIISDVQASNYSVSNATLTFADRLNSLKVKTNSDELGNFSIDLPQDVYTITVEKEGYKTFTETIEIEPGKNYNLQVILDSGNKQEYGGYATTEEDSTIYKLNTGWNVITLNTAPETDDYMASDLLGDISSDDAFVTRIMRYRGGKWEVYKYGDHEDNDFRLILGEGYILKANRGGQFELSGKSLDKPVPVKISTGWNLIGVPYSESEYTAVSLIDAANGSGESVDTITKWESKWVNVIKEEGLVYGHDFKIDNQAGY